MTFGKTLKKIRIEKGLTQKQLADSLHVTFQTVSKWENDINEPGYTAIKDIANALNCSVTKLFNEKESENLLSSETIKIKKMPELIAETYRGVAKISNTLIREYCNDVVSFIKRKLCEQTVKDGFFKDEKDFEQNYLIAKSYVTIVYGMSISLDELASGNDFYKFFELERMYLYEDAIQEIFEQEKKYNLKIVNNVNELMESLKKSLVFTPTKSEIKRLKGVDIEQLYRLNLVPVTESIVRCRKRHMECATLCERFLIGY